MSRIVERLAYSGGDSSIHAPYDASPHPFLMSVGRLCENYGQRPLVMSIKVLACVYAFRLTRIERLTIHTFGLNVQNYGICVLDFREFAWRIRKCHDNSERRDRNSRGARHILLSWRGRQIPHRGLLYIAWTYLQ